MYTPSVITALPVLCALVSLVAQPMPVAAWGSAGHEIVADIAASQLESNTNYTVWKILDASMASVANWADEATHESYWEWTKPYHFINVNSTQCDFEYSRDCYSKSGEYNMCVDDAITRYTKNLQYTMLKSLIHRMAQGGKHSEHVRTMSTQEKASTFDSMKFVIHFIGDIHQPLHVGHLSDFGGHYDVTFLGNKTNLHDVWDYVMINYKIQTSFQGSQNGYLTQLLQDIGAGGKFESDVAGWKQCSSMSYSGVACPDEWAQESIQAACKYAYPNAGPNAALGLPYYDATIGEVDLCLAKAGVRLGNTLNLIYKSAVAALNKEIGA